MAYYLHFIYYAILVLAVLIGIVRSYKANFGHSILLAVLFVTGLVEFSTILLDSNISHRQIPHHLLPPIQGTLVFIFIAYINRFLTQGRIMVVVSAWVIISIINIVLFQPLQYLNSNTILLESFVGCIMFIATLYKMARQPQVILIYHPAFWVCSAFLIFNSSTFLFVGFLHYLSAAHPAVTASLLIYHEITNCLFYLILCFILYMFSHKQFVI